MNNSYKYILISAAIVIAAIVLGFALASYSPEITLFGFFVLYGLSGYVLAAVGLLKRKSA